MEGSVEEKSGHDFAEKERRSGSKLFFGWWTVLVTGLVSGFGHGFYAFGISVFFKNIASELAINRALTSTAAGIGRLEGGITSPLVGWLSDKYGPRWVVFSGVFFAGAGLVMMKFIHSVATYLVAWGVIVGVGLNIGLTIAVDKAINDWFINKRGLAQGTKFALIGVGGVIVIPIVTALVEAYGWRTMCFIWGCLMLLCAPVCLLFVKQKRPEYYGFLPDGFRTELDHHILPEEMVNRGVEYATSFHENEFALRQALKTHAYWLMTAAYTIQIVVSGALNIHMIPFLTDLGIELAVASGMMSLMVFSSIPSRFIGGVMADRVGKERLKFLMAAVFFLQATGITAFLLDRGIVSIYMMIVCYGICSGASVPLLMIIIGRYFGRKAFGSILGISNAIRAPFAMIAPVFAGWIYDLTGRYIVALILFAAASAFAMILMCDS